MAQVEQHPLQPSRQRNRPIYYLYAGVMFLSTFSPLLGFGASVFHFIFSVTHTLPLLMSSLVALPFPILGLGLGLWYAVTQFYHCKKLERFLEQKIAGLCKLQFQLHNQYDDLGEHPELQQFLLTLQGATEAEADGLCEAYQQLGLKQLSRKQFFSLYDAMREPGDESIQTRLKQWAVLRAKSQPGWVITKPKGAAAWFSEKIVIPFRTFTGISILTFSLISVLVTLAISTAIIVPSSIFAFPIGFTALLAVAGSVGLMAALTVGFLQKKMLGRQRTIRQLAHVNKRLSLMNQVIQDLGAESRFFNRLSGRIPNDMTDPPRVKLKTAEALKSKLARRRQALLNNFQRLVKPNELRNDATLQRPAKARQGLDSAIVFLSTVVPLLGLGAAAVNVFLSSSLPGFFFSMGVLIAVAVPVAAIGLGLWFSRSQFANYRIRDKMQIRQIAEAAGRPSTAMIIQKMLCDKSLLALLNLVKQAKSQQLKTLYQDYQKRGGKTFDFDDLCFLRSALANRSTQQALEDWSQYKVEKNLVQQQLTAGQKSEAAPLPLPINLFAEKMMRPAQAAQQMSLLSFSLLSMLVTTVFSASLLGLSVSLPVVVGAIITISVCSSLLGIFAGQLIKSIQKHNQTHRMATEEDAQYLQLQQKQKRQVGGLKDQSGLFVKLAKKQCPEKMHPGFGEVFVTSQPATVDDHHTPGAVAIPSF